MPRQVDEHGEVTLDPAMPPDVQTSDEGQRRWTICASLASRITGEPLTSVATGNLARAFYDSPAATDDREFELTDVDGQLTIIESQISFQDRLHPRDRRGRWRDVINTGSIAKTIASNVAPKSPGVAELDRLGLDDLLKRCRDLGLDHKPKPSEKTRQVLGDAKSTVERHRHRAEGRRDVPGAAVRDVYSTERRATHDAIIGRALAPAASALLGRDHEVVRRLEAGQRLREADRDALRQAADASRGGEAPDALFLAGGTASGKSSLLRANPDLLPVHAVRVDPDELKNDLPEYGALRGLGDHYAAAAVHQESGDLATRLEHEARDLRLSLVLDGTGNSESGKFAREIRAVQGEGYDASVLYVTVPTDEGVRRSLVRALETGRYVPIPRVREIHRRVSENFAEVRKIDGLRELDVFADGEHIGTLHDGEFIDIDDDAMAAFREKANEDG